MAKFKNLNPVAVVVTRGDGGRLFVGGQKVVETEDPKWIRRLELRKDFQNVEEVVEHKTGAGVKTHIRGSKVDRKPSRAKPKKEVKSKSKAKPKKPKGLKKSKRAD
tara:strand:- start:1092 stop:1409 length:318 start_codon:yes stop_codon:yes gene_type:complete